MDVGARIVLDGEREFRQAIIDINTALKLNQSELDLTASKYRDNIQSTSAYQERIEGLKTSIETQKTKLDALSQGLIMAAEKYGEASRQTQRLQTDYNKAEIELNKMTDSLDKEVKAANNSTKSNKDNEMATRSMGDENKTASGKIDVLTVALGNLAAEGIKKSITAMKDFLKTSIEFSSDLEEVQNVVDVTFAGQSKTIDEWSKDLISNFGLSELAAKEYASTTGAMLKSSGITDGLIEMSIGVSELTGDFASFYNLSHEEVFTKIQSGLTGQTQPLRSLGINMSVANLETSDYVLTLGRAWDELTEAEKVTARYNYILEHGADAIGDFERNTDSFANTSVRLQAIMSKLGIEIGDILKDKLKVGMGALFEFISSNEGIILSLASTLGELLEILIGLAIKAMPMLIKSFETIAFVVDLFAPILMVVLELLGKIDPMFLLIIITVFAAVKAFIAIQEKTKSLSKVFEGGFATALDTTAIKVAAVVAVVSILLYLILALKEGSDRAANSMKNFSNSANSAKNVKPPKSKGYAKGTNYAKRGFAWVGEEGPELMFMRGGEKILNASHSAKLASNSQRTLAGSNTPYIGILNMTIDPTNIHSFTQIENEITKMTNIFKTARQSKRAKG